MVESMSVKTLKTRSVETLELAIRQPLPASASSLNVSVERVETLRESGDEGRLQGAFELDDSDVVMRNESSLAPVDRGFQAWSFLFGAFLVEAIVWGFPDTFGVFLAAYLNDPRFAKQKSASSVLPLVGNLSSGIMYFDGPIVYSLAIKYPYLRRPAIFCGTVICFLSLFGASYASKVEQLVILQGVMYAIGGSLVYHPCISYTSEWFVARRGLANGVIYAGTAVGGLVLPLVLPRLLSRYGSQVTLRIVSVAIICLVLPILPFIKGRLPESRIHGPSARSMDYSWLKSWIFWWVMLVNTVQAFAYFVPILWLPTFATAMHVSDTNAALALALLNGTAIVARLAVGAMVDRMNPWIIASSTLFCTSVATFVLWGVLSHSLAGLLAYGVAFGTLASGWSSIWVGFIRPMARDDPRLITTFLGLLGVGRGLGQVLSTPISTSLLRDTSPSSTWPWYSKTGFEVAGGRFERLIVYVGASFAGAAAIAACGWKVEKASVA
ncbi:MFS general substrate transporter [Heliocybe sulcata]|uniref:MFS general substrate transporter n=1 Tax=Heliocybe sulcata TaxID=5364 RepID=A0A5C3N566_9AGAM|nr:MFS general substrate transporter [Heliocybe sulcata]